MTGETDLASLLIALALLATSFFTVSALSFSFVIVNLGLLEPASDSNGTTGGNSRSALLALFRLASRSLHLLALLIFLGETTVGEIADGSAGSSDFISSIVSGCDDNTP